ncbi:MAG: hypothetical protein GY842_27000 [bacterium]|nr:hypothetical protein [bacterium]
MSQALPNPRAPGFRALLLGALVLEAAFVLPHLARTPAEQIGLVLLSYILGGAAFAWVLWHLWDARNRLTSRRTLAPDAAELAPVARKYPTLSQAVTHRHIPTIYPPFAQFLFWCNAMPF